MPRSRTDYIAIHCSATQPLQDIGAKEIDRWHRAKGWLGIGYHWVIRRNGVVEPGRPLMNAGAHVEGFNWNSIGICLVGGVNASNVAEANFTDLQWSALHKLLVQMKQQFPTATIQGHRDFPKVAKACPSFDVRAWLKANPL